MGQGRKRSHYEDLLLRPLLWAIGMCFCLRSPEKCTSIPQNCPLPKDEGWEHYPSSAAPPEWSVALDVLTPAPPVCVCQLPPVWCLCLLYWKSLG